jgi:O-antigen ligase
MLNYYLQFRNTMTMITNNLFVLLTFLFTLSPSFAKKQLLALLLFFWIFSVDFKKLYIIFLENKIMQVLFIFSIFMITSILWSENIKEAYYWNSYVFRYYFGLILIVVTVLKFEYISKIIFAFILAMFINELLSYYIFFTDARDIFGIKFIGSSFNPVPFVKSHMEYSSLIAFTLLVMIYTTSYLKNKFLKFVSLIFIITMTINLFLSSGRTGQFSFFLTSLIIIFIYVKNKKTLLVWFITLLITFIVAFNLSNTFNIRINQTITNVQKALLGNNYASSIGVRLSSYIVAPKILKDTNIFYGTGVGDIRDTVHKKHIELFGKGTTFDNQQGHLHNTYLTIILSLGIVGLFLYISFLYLFISLHIYDKKLTYIKYIFIFMIIFSSLAENIFRQSDFMIFFSIFASLIIVASLKENKNKQIFLQ